MEQIAVRTADGWIVVSGFGMRVYYPATRYTKYQAARDYRERFTNF